MPTTIHNTGITFPDLTTQTTAASAGGQIQSQLFTSPGTWTKPASCTQVRVVVVGGGGGGNNGGGAGGNPGNTSSFGPFISCTGGSGAPVNGGNGSDGSASVSSGTILKSGNQRSSPSTSLGIIIGSTQPGAGGLGTYSTSDTLQAGKNGSGANYGGGGGYAWVTGIPVTGPVSVTVGSGGSSPGTTNQGAVGGAVAVEFVG